MMSTNENTATPTSSEAAQESVPRGHGEPRSGSLASKLALGALLLAAIGIFVPIQTEPGMGIEYWWPVALSRAFLSKLQFGVDVIDTYGPWGFVIGGYHPQTLALATALRGLITVVAVLAVWDIGRRSSRRGWPAALLVMFTLIVAVICWSDFLVTIWTLVYLVRTIEFPEGRTSPLGIALLVVSGLVALMKFSSFVGLGVILAVVTIDNISRRKWPVSLAVWVSSIAILWLIAGQNPSAFPRFVRWSMEIAASYTEAVGIDAKLYQPWSTLPFIVSTSLLAVASILRCHRRELASAALQLPAIWISLFFLFKWGFVRADHFHIAPACGALLVTQVMFTLVWLSNTSGNRRRWIAVPLLLSISISLWLVHGFVYESVASEVGQTITEAWSGVRRLGTWSTYEQGLLSNHAKALAMLPPLDPATLTNGTADAYPAAAGIVLRTGVDYEPRPVFRSYHTFTPALAWLNANHLQTAPPDLVVFTIKPIDHRYPSLEDGASWPYLLANYTVTRRVPHAIVLRHRDGTRAARLAAVNTIEARLGERVLLQENSPSPTYARIEIDLTPTGRLLNFIYKPPELEIETSLSDGSQRTRRLIRRMAASEFLLSPYVDSAEAFEELLPRGDESPSTEQLTVRDFKISVKGSDSAYYVRYKVTFLSAVSP